MKRYFLLLILVALYFIGTAQPMPEQPKNPGNPSLPSTGSVKGKILEAGSNTPLEYANIIIYSQNDSTFVAGTTASVDGTFTIGPIAPGNYFVDAKFLGYNHLRRYDITINRQNPMIDLGVLELLPATENISEVTVTTKSKAIAYEIDKKIVDPAQFPAAADGTAVDILANTPSVSVDIEGNVALRGSSSFTVLIDGRPTPFESAEALQQIPASSIRNIEIITNPSAKFDPDGNAGIININTKKSKLDGVSGIINAMGDTNGSLSGDLLLNYRTGKFNFFVGANLANRRGGGNTESKTTTTDTLTSENSSWGEGNRGRNSYSIKTGFDFYIDDYNTLTFTTNVDSRKRFEQSTLDFKESNSTGYLLESLTENNGENSGENLAFSLDYRRIFDNPGQELTAYFYYEMGKGEEYSFYNQYDGNKQLLKGQKSWEVGTGQQFRAKVDYIHPFPGKKKLETGYQARIDRDNEWNDVHWLTALPDSYQPGSSSPLYTDTKFSRDIHALYAMFSNGNSRWGYQLGLRSEYTNRVLTYSASPKDFKINRPDFFPTAHFSFNLPLEQQVIASYTRRIERPRGFALEPFITYIDAYSVRTGNPDILPEYIDSYELGYQKQIKNGFISAEAYFRQTNNKMERVQSVYQQNIIMGTVANVGTDYSVGVELMFNFKPVKWWTLNLMGNLYNYRLDGEYNGQDLETSSNNWNSRLNNTFLLGKNTRFQVDAMYNSPTVSAQGRREGFLFTNVAIRQDFFNNQMSATLGVRDVLNTAKFEFSSEGPGFSSYRKFDMKSPVVSLTLSYRLNNYKTERKTGENGLNGGSNDMDMEGGGEM